MNWLDTLSLSWLAMNWRDTVLLNRLAILLAAVAIVSELWAKVGDGVKE